MPDRYTPDMSLFLRSLAHDLRTPLASVYGFAKTIERLGDPDERTRRFLTLIQDAAVDLERQIDLAGVTGHALSPGFEPVRAEITLRAFGLRIEGDLAPRTDGRSFDIDLDSIARIETDPERASRAVALLLEACLRNDPGLTKARLRFVGDALAIERLPPAIAATFNDHGRDLQLETAKTLLGICGGRAEVDDDGVIRVTFPNVAYVAMRHGLGLVSSLLGELIEAGSIPAQPVAALAHVLIGALDEASLYVALADHPDAARAEVAVVLRRLLVAQSSPRSTDEPVRGGSTWIAATLE